MEEIKVEEKEVERDGVNDDSNNVSIKTGDNNDTDNRTVDSKTIDSNTVETTKVAGDTLTPSEASESNEKEHRTEEKLLTQSQVNELVGKARQEGRESAMKEILERYGVGNDTELNEVFGKGQIYDDLNHDYENQGRSYRSVMAENALLKSQIAPDRWEDVKLILGGKGLEVNTENILAMLDTHPEWRSADNRNAEDNSTDYPGVVKSDDVAKLRKLGNDPSPEKQDSEDEIVKKLFGFQEEL